MHILVTGATGYQGGAVARKLIENKHQVRALVRDPNSKASQELQSLGVELAIGDLNNLKSLVQAMQGVDGVFSAQQASLEDDTEVKQAQNIADAAKQAGVNQIVHTSVIRVGTHESWPGWADGMWQTSYWLHKLGAVQAIINSGVEHWTILQPSYFFENLLQPRGSFMAPGLTKGVIDTSINPESKVPFIACRDIANFAVAAFENPTKFDGKRIDMGSEFFPYGELGQVISKGTGRNVTMRHHSYEDVVKHGVHPSLVNSHKWVNEIGYKDPRPGTEGYGIPLYSLEDFARDHADQFGFE